MDYPWSSETHDVNEHEMLELYEICAWNNGGWRSSEDIKSALKNSQLVISVRDNKGLLIGFGRVVGDSVFVNQIVDLIVRPEYRGKGIATSIMRIIQEKGPNATMLVDGSGIDGLYQRMGFTPAEAEGVYYWEK